MENGKRLEDASKKFGRCAIAVYDGCKSRRSALSLADKLLNSCTLVGGYVEGIIINGDDGERLSLAANEIYRARYMAKTIGENNLCRDKTVREFLGSANNLLHALLDPEPARANPSGAKAKPAGAKKSKKRNDVSKLDPDGFDDIFEEPSKRK